jgi:GT2 family glycosyltransferase
MDEKHVSIITVTRNRKELVKQCLHSIFQMNYHNFEMILVDNDSTDGTVEAVRKNFPLVKVIEAKKNLGLNGGKNLGQKYAKGDYVLFLDSDTVVDKNFLTELIKLAETDPRIGIVCPKMYYYDIKDTIWYAGSYVNLLTSQTKNIGCNEKDLGQWDEVRATQFAPTAYLTSKQLVDTLKEHNEDFFMTYGDTDYGLRALKKGFKVLFCPNARLWHYLNMNENIKSIRALGYNLPMRAYYFSRNRAIFMKRHAPKVNFIIFMLVFFPIITVYFCFKIISLGGGWSFLKLHLSGSLDGLKYVLGGKLKNKYV